MESRGPALLRKNGGLVHSWQSVFPWERFCSAARLDLAQDALRLIEISWNVASGFSLRHVESVIYSHCTYLLVVLLKASNPLKWAFNLSDFNGMSISKKQDLKETESLGEALGLVWSERLTCPSAAELAGETSQEEQTEHGLSWCHVSSCFIMFHQPILAMPVWFKKYQKIRPTFCKSLLLKTILTICWSFFSIWVLSEGSSRAGASSQLQQSQRAAWV